jgi:XTP/dITP diphosphohydrolase
MPGLSRVSFATSNDHKFNEVRFILRGSGLRLDRLRSKGTEIQSDDPREIAAAAAAEAFRKHGVPLFVEDTALRVEALRGFPGSYSSYVYGTIGPRGLLTLLDPAKDRSAAFISAVAFCGHPGKTKVFVGRLRGSIAPELRGSGGFGFDSVFIPEAEERTLAELSISEKCAISHRAGAVRGFVSWYQGNRRRQRL